MVAIPSVCLAAGALIAGLADQSNRVVSITYCDTFIAALPWVKGAVVNPCFGGDLGPLIMRLSALAFLPAIAPVVVFALAALVCGKSRVRIVRVFPPLVPLVVVAVFLNLLVQGLLLMLVLDTISRGTLALWLILAAIVVVVAAIWVFWASIQGLLFRAIPVHGLPVTREEAPDLWDFVAEMARKLQAPLPEHALLGLEPGFWVAEGTVVPFGPEDRRLKGRILYLSAPLLRILDRGELTSIVGHELAHFRGADTEYTARFVPVYGALIGAHSGLDQMITSTLNEIGIVRLVTSILHLPLRALVDILAGSFARNVGAVAREREYAADRAAIQIAPAAAFATALVKTALYSGLWEQLYWNHLAFSLEGRKCTASPAACFAASAHLYCDAETAARLSETALEQTIEHPFDSHPSNLDRIRRAGVDPATIAAGEIARVPARGVGRQLVPGLDTIETALDTAMCEGYGAFASRDLQEHAGEKRRPESLQRIFDALYALLAPFVMFAPDPAGQFRAVLEVADETESRFDCLAFGAVCAGLQAIPPRDRTIAVLDRELGAQGRGQVVKYLTRLSGGLAPDASGPGGPETLERLVRQFEKPPPPAESRPR